MRTVAVTSHRPVRTTLLSLLMLGLAALPAAAAGGDRFETKPKLDPKRIINNSMSFLRQREPDISAEENALYEKALQLVTTKPEYALTLLEGIVEKSIGKEPASPAFDLLLGNVYFASDQIEKAEAKYLSAVERYPTFLRAWINLGALYYAGGDYRRTISSLAKAIALGDRESTTFGMMALSLEKTGDAVGAELAFVQALAVDPGNVSWMDGLLRVFMRAKQYSRAEVMVRNLIKERPTDPEYWLIYARIMVGDGRKLEAIALLEQTLATGIAGPDELTELAGLYADENLIPEALRAYEKIEVRPELLGERRTIQLIRILTGCSEWQKAQALLDAHRRLGGTGQEPLLRLQADLFAAQEKWGEARKVLEELLQLNPTDGHALVSLGRGYLAEGDEVHAMLAFEAAVQTKEGAYPASLALANLELKHRHYEQSVSHLERALSLEKNDDVQDLLTRVRSLVPPVKPVET